MPVPGTEVYADGLTLAAGGGAYITAAWLVALGQPAALAAHWPAAPFDAAIMAQVTAAGVDAAACVAAPSGADPQVTLALVTGGDRAFVTRRAGPAVPASLIDVIAAGRHRHLHVGELATLVEAPMLVRAARAAGMTVSADCAWDAEVLARRDLATVLEGVDVFLPNRMEAEALARHQPLAALAPLVVVKEGAEGATAITHEQKLHRPARPVKVVDTVGAGDAFNAGFLTGWLAGRGLAACLDAGAAAAAQALVRRGGASGLARGGLAGPRTMAAHSTGVVADH
ncbi:MAG TPA: PfkB family carbohydrate kinase [Paracoccaceae bacterium]|nr:PfkB family carbohydrate kinase [Paracoccaceae bacterium]